MVDSEDRERSKRSTAKLSLVQFETQLKLADCVDIFHRSARTRRWRPGRFEIRAQTVPGFRFRVEGHVAIAAVGLEAVFERGNPGGAVVMSCLDDSAVTYVALQWNADGRGARATRRLAEDLLAQFSLHEPGLWQERAKEMAWRRPSEWWDLGRHY